MLNLVIVIASFLCDALDVVVRCLFLSTFTHNVYAMLPSDGVPLPWL